MEAGCLGDPVGPYVQGLRGGAEMRGGACGGLDAYARGLGTFSSPAEAAIGMDATSFGEPAEFPPANK